MLKRTFKYTDFNDKEVEKDYYFHLSEADLVELEVSAGREGLNELLKKIVEAEDGVGIIENFKKIILMSVGEKTSDGSSFLKTNAIRDHFAGTPAYSELFVELATDAEAGAKFIRGVVPGKLAAKIPQDYQKPAAKVKQAPAEMVEVSLPVVEEVDFSKMTAEEFVAWQASRK